MNYEAIAYAMMAEGHCRATVNEALFDTLTAGRQLTELLRSAEVVRELEKLAGRFETVGQSQFCQHIQELYGPAGSRLAGLVVW